ncbi:MAG: 50S ribosomal protein L13 [bacterium]|nr:50S ribosomal protein L13 [bacterium]
MTKVTKSYYDIKRNWWLVDLKDKVLGRVASKVAVLLMGKHKPTYTPHVDGGDYVVAINAAYIKLTGKKLDNKVYRHWSGYQGGLKRITYKELIKKNPEFVFYLAVKRMLPKNKLGKRMITRLRIYKDENYIEKAQKPKFLDI